MPVSGSCSGSYDVNATLTLGGSAAVPNVAMSAEVTGSLSCPGGGGGTLPPTPISDNKDLILGGSCM